MATETALQSLALLLLAGMGMGLLSTGYGAVRAVWRLGRIIEAACDWLWWVFAAFYTFACLVWIDWGVVRLWYLAALGVGYLLWAWLAAPVVYPALAKAVWCQARTVHAVLWPFRFSTRLFLRSARWLTRCGKSLGKRWLKR